MFYRVIRRVSYDPCISSTRLLPSGSLAGELRNLYTIEGANREKRGKLQSLTVGLFGRSELNPLFFLMKDTIG